jgi:hypothetical protein
MTHQAVMFRWVGTPTEKIKLFRCVGTRTEANGKINMKRSHSRSAATRL